ncbi:enhancer of rudimentary-domain-containing protein [Gongronella butleri]|nr:enhancer of rudimentary-domain-containing protein [Gongronella butleri]
MTHTILLVQQTPEQATRRYYDFESIGSAMEEVATLYEAQLLRVNPRLTKLEYNAEDLLRFIDQHEEFVALVLNSSTKMYEARDPAWIKDKLIAHFTAQQQHHQQDVPQRSNHGPRGGGRGRGRGGRRF